MKAGSAAISVWTENYNTKVSKSIFGWPHIDCFSITCECCTYGQRCVTQLCSAIFLLFINNHRIHFIVSVFIMVLLSFSLWFKKLNCSPKLDDSMMGLTMRK